MAAPRTGGKWNVARANVGRATSLRTVGTQGAIQQVSFYRCFEPSRGVIRKPSAGLLDAPAGGQDEESMRDIETSPNTKPVGNVPVPAPGRGLDFEPERPTFEESAAINLPFERATVYDAHGKVLFHKDGNASHVDFTDAEIERMGGTRLTHNHPDGNSFSDEDLAFAAGADLAEIRIVCGTCEKGAALFRLERAADGWALVPAQMLAAYRDAAEVVRSRQAQSKAAGEISGREARRAFTHEVMELLRERFPDIILYTRIEL